jgi:hypothetical protein
MISQIFSHTPLFVWAILAFLVYRGVIALRTREVPMNKLYIIPVVMLALSLVDIAGKFGLDGMPFATWIVTAAATLALLVRFSAARVTPASTPGNVVVRGSVWPLVLMMAIFVTKYITSVAVAIQPALRLDARFSMVVCALFGIFSGYFLGRLARDLKAYHGFTTPFDAARHAV